MHVICYLQEHLYVAYNFFCLQRRLISLRHPATSFLGNIFWRPSCPSPTATRTTHLWVTTSFLSLNSKHDFYYVYSDAFFAQTFSIALTAATHIPFRHLAAIIPSQLNNYPLPSYETCSIKVPFILAAIKPSWKPYGIFVLLLQYSDEVT